MMDERTGGCMCGAVRFTARLERKTYGACHCDMCRRWTGSALLAISVPDDNIRWTGTDSIKVLHSSAWAKRAWCDGCGSGLYYKFTDGPHTANHEIPIGLFDNADGLVMESEIYIDQKPDAFAYTGSATRYTRAETLALIGMSASPEE